jgi:hypothetical protein
LLGLTRRRSDGRRAIRETVSLAGTDLLPWGITGPESFIEDNEPMIKTKFTRKKLIFAVAMIPFLLLSAQAFGQSGSVSGTVTDTSRAVLPGATMSATNNATGIKTTVTTNSAGAYNFAALPPGTYTVIAEMPGFQTVTRTDVSVGPAAALRLNVEMPVAGVATQVEVTSSAANLLLESSSSTGVVMNEQTVTELPLLGNDVMQLINVMGGVVKPENTIFGADAQALAGVTSQNINITRDGISVSDVRWANGITSPEKLNPEMIGEFKLILSPVDAELGRGAGQIQVLTKSGGNEYHGSAVWSVLNPALDATDWNDNRLGTVRDWQNVNQYTLSGGGPIIKNKAFFFVTWDQNIVKKRTSVNGRALTPCARKGIYRYWPGWDPGNRNDVQSTTGVPVAPSVDASGYPLPPAGSGLTIDDLKWGSVLGELSPTAMAQVAADPINCSQYDFALGNTGVVAGTNWDRDYGNWRQGYDSTGYIDRFTALMPMPNYYGVGDGLNVAALRWTRTNNGSDTVYGNGFDVPRKSISAKIDYNINASNRLSGTTTYERSIADTSETTWPNGYGGVNERIPVTFTGTLTSTLRPTLLNEFRVGMSYNESHNVAPLDGPYKDQLMAALQELMPTDNFPLWSGLPFTFGPGNGDFRFDPNVGNILGGRNPYEDTWGSFDYRYTFGDTITWTKGSHSFKFGGEIRLTKANSDRNGAGAWGEVSPAWYPNIQGGVTPNSRQQGLSDPRAVAQFPGLVGQDISTGPTGSYAGIYNLMDYFVGSLSYVRQYYFVNDPNSSTWSDPTTPAGQVNNLAMNQHEASFFFKDDWKVNADLTLNLGLRYEYYGVPWLINGTTAGLIGGAASMFGGSAGGFTDWLRANNTQNLGGVPDFDPSKLATYEFIGPNSPNPDQRLYNKDLNNFGPAVGFAWQLPWFGKGKTTLRGGYQMNYISTGRMDPNAGPMQVAGGQPGLTFLDSYNGTPSVNPYLDISMIPQLVPTDRFWNAATPQPLVVKPIPVTNLNGSGYVYDPNLRTPYIQSLTLALTRQIGSNITVDVRYIGTLSRKQITSINLNEANWISNGLKQQLDIVARGGESEMINAMVPGGALTGPPSWSGSQQLRVYSATDLATGNYENVASVLGTSNGTIPVASGVNGQLLRNTGLFPANFIFTNPQFGVPAGNPAGAAAVYGNNNHSNYHSLQAQITLRPTHGLNFQATYTWSRNLGMLANADPLNRAEDYGILAINRSHMLTTYGTYNLPLGSSGYLFRDSSGFVKKLVEGWQLSWISSVTSGLPDSVSTVQSMWGGSGVDLVRPDLFDTKGGHITWENGASNGLYFGDQYVQVTDPRCATLAASLQGTCAQNLKALALRSDPSVIVFQKADPGTRGNFALNQLTGPGRWSLDMAMSKNIEFMEGKSINFRVDVNNIFNHPTPTASDPGTAGGATYNYRDYWWTNPNFNLNSSNPFGFIQYKAGHRVFSAKVRITF